jgi:cytochrome c
MLKTLHSVIFLFSVFLFGYTVIPGSHQTINHAPLIKIIQPVNNARYDWGTRVPYSIEVSDQEDGESKYQEIQSSEVLVSIKYVGNKIKGSAFLKQKNPQDSATVTSMMVSNCFNCHSIKAKMAGPSYQDISKKYQHTANNLEQLVNHIQKGSTGIWGKEVMPTHPELPDTVVRQMVKWILNDANDPGLNYYIGLQGVLILNKPGISDHAGRFIVTAFYTDHGSVDFPKKRISGSGQVIIQMN